MNLVAFALLLQTAASTLTPTPTVTPARTPSPAPAPTPTPTRGPFQPRTLQDVARERRLKTGQDAKASGSLIELGPTARGTRGATPAASPSASPGSAEATPTDGGSTFTEVRVVSASSDGIVDPAGVVRVSGTIRNSGDRAVCSVSILVKILDSRGTYLASTQTAADVSILPVGETASFHATIQAPPGVRGARLDPDRRDVTEGSTSMAGDWRLLGGTEAKVVDASPCAK